MGLKVNELIGFSPAGVEEAARSVLLRTNRTLRGVEGIEVLEEKARVKDGRITEYLVTMQVIFILEEPRG